MSDKINDGGSAFPAEYFDVAAFTARREIDGLYDARKNATGVSKGMSLRDWFAGMAMQGLYAGRNPDGSINLNLVNSDAEVAYAVADAMLAARKDGAE